MQWRVSFTDGFCDEQQVRYVAAPTRNAAVAQVVASLWRAPIFINAEPAKEDECVLV
jgi:hypothetical protein